MVSKYDISSVVVDFQKFGIAFESSGAFRRQALSLWSELKYDAAEIGLGNYIVSGKPHTWSAFTFEQMLPQKVSWKIHYKNARSVMTMSSHSKASRVELIHGLAH